MLAQLGDEAKVLAGGQSLIPLMKLRFANPRHLVDLNFVPGTCYIKEEWRRSALRSTDPACCRLRIPQLLLSVPILHDCAAGIADVQIRNRGTIGGSLAEADPSGDWAAVLTDAENGSTLPELAGRAGCPAGRFYQGCVYDSA